MVSWIKLFHVFVHDNRMAWLFFFFMFLFL